MPKLITKHFGTRIDNDFGEFLTGGYRYHEDDGQVVNHLIICREGIDFDSPIDLRIQSGCLTGHVFGDTNCDCQEQLDKSFEFVKHNLQGMIIYTPEHDGRGRGTIEKMRVYQLRAEKNINSEQACEILGYTYEKRDYSSICMLMLDMEIKQVNLLSTNKKKKESIEKAGIVVMQTKELNEF